MIFLTMPHRSVMPTMTRAVRELISRFHSHQAPANGTPTAKPGFSQNASASWPCHNATSMRWAPQKGQLSPVSQWNGQMIIVFFLSRYT